MVRSRNLFIFMIACSVLAVTVAGCRDHFPHSWTAPLPGGPVEYSHPEPMEGGYYTNWDPYAKSIEIDKVVQTTPVGSQQILIATVRDKNGDPLPNRRVEWIIPEGASGAFVEVDESGWRASRGYKMTNTLAVTHTNNFDHVLTRGNDDPSDDIKLKRGQTWAVVTSAGEGTTDVIAYAPGIYNWKEHKAFAKVNWFDVKFEGPPSARNAVGTDHTLTTKVNKHSDGSAIEGHVVNYRIESGPKATFGDTGKDTASVKTDSNGEASITLKQVEPMEGVNEISIEVVRPENKECCIPAAVMGTATTTKTWVGPDIAIRKSGPRQAVIDRNFTYTIQVSNPAEVEATNVVVTDTLPEGLTYVSSSPEADRDGRKLTWEMASLAGGESETLRVTVKGAEQGSYENCADVKADMGLSGRDCATTEIVKAALELTKSGPEEALICEPIKYSLTVRNTGAAEASNVKIVDKLPDGLVSRDGEQEVTFNVGTLSAGAARTVSFIADAKSTGNYTNNATVTADGGLEAKASAQTRVREPVLKITKTGAKTQYIGRAVTYTINVSNTGDAEARNTMLVDTLGNGAEFIEASNGGTLRNGKVVWNLGTIAPDASKKVTVKVNLTEAGTISNTAEATAFCAKAVTASASTKVTGIAAILLECVDQVDPVQVGDNETYTITVTNQGTADATKVNIVVVLPDEQEYVSSDGPTKANVDGQKIVFDPLAKIAPKDEAKWKVVVKGLKPGDVRFRVEMSSADHTKPVIETESTTIYEPGE
ncbi:MAG: COG1361 S-layer family protein [Phycisphaerae bacterium]